MRFIKRLMKVVQYKKPPLENSAFLGYYAASSGNFLPTCQDNLSVPSSRIKKPTIAQFSSTSGGRPEIKPLLPQ
jgi:hypothetical protein